MGRGADGDRVYEQEVARPRGGEFKKNKEGGEDKGVDGRSPKRDQGRRERHYCSPWQNLPRKF